MRKKNSLPIKWVLGAFIILTVIVYGTNQLSKNMLASTGSSVASHNIFFEFLANLLGGQYKSILSNEGLSENNLSNQNYSGSGGPANAGNQRNLTPTGAANGSASQGLNSSQKGNNAANNAEMGAESNAEFNAKSSLGTGGENNPESTTELNAESNTENNPNDNSETNADQGTGNITESNAENNAETNSENNLGSNPENNTGSGSGENPETNSDQGPENYSGGAQDNLNPAGLPTINPIPSDNTVSQNIAQQNQQSDTLAALLAAKHALVVPVEQEAQATKYQTVTSQNLPAVSTNQAPADAVAKIKSNQVMATH